MKLQNFFHKLSRHRDLEYLARSDRRISYQLYQARGFISIGSYKPSIALFYLSS